MEPKRKSDKDEDYNTSFSSKKRRLPASLMEDEDIDALKIFYDETSTSIPDFLTLLKERKSRTTFPDVGSWFIELTERHLNLNLDIDKIPQIGVESGPAIEERELIEYLEEESRQLEKLRLSELKKWNFLEDSLKLVLFNEWISSTKKFIELTQVMVQQLILSKSADTFDPGPSTSKEKKDEEKSKTAEENIFSDVFARFTEIFFLLPVTSRKTSSWMKNKLVGSVPDLRYYQYIPRGAPYPVLLMFCEVKREPSQKSNGASKTSIGQKLNKKVLGQVGIELVSKCFCSVFLPNVLGIICMRTEIIFVYLTINPNHVKAIRTNENVDEHKADIHYTEAFDIMKKEDRTKILELMFWLGCLQKYNLHRYYLKQ